MCLCLVLLLLCVCVWGGGGSWLKKKKSTFSTKHNVKNLGLFPPLNRQNKTSCTVKQLRCVGVQFGSSVGHALRLPADQITEDDNGKPTSRVKHRPLKDRSAEDLSQRLQRLRVFASCHLRTLSPTSSSSSSGRTGRISPEHVDWSFLDPEDSFVTVRRTFRTRFAKQKFAQLRKNVF